MWLKVLKVAAKVAISLGLHTKAKNWVSKKLGNAAEKVETKLVEKVEKIQDEVEEGYILETILKNSK